LSIGVEVKEIVKDNHGAGATNTIPAKQHGFRDA